MLILIGCNLSLKDVMYADGSVGKYDITFCHNILRHVSRSAMISRLRCTHGCGNNDHPKPQFPHTISSSIREYVYFPSTTCKCAHLISNLAIRFMRNNEFIYFGFQNNLTFLFYIKFIVFLVLFFNLLKEQR